MLSVVIPALNEVAGIAKAVASAFAAGAGEVVVVDGGGEDGTADAARGAGAVVIDAPRGRASQMNAGALISTGDLLLFLHADTTLPADAGKKIRHALTDANVVGGAFCVSLTPSDRASAWTRLSLRLISRGIGWRARNFGPLTGDQGIFVRTRTFRDLGGFPEVPLMEDVLLSRAMERCGLLVVLDATVESSGRRFEGRGPWRTIALMWFLRAAHALGMPPERCARIYRPNSPT